jgi:hypothetical protein
MQLLLHQDGQWVLCFSRGVRFCTKCPKRTMLHKGFIIMLDKWKWTMHWINILTRSKTSALSYLSQLWEIVSHQCHSWRSYYKARLRFINHWTIYYRLCLPLRSRMACLSTKRRCDIFEHSNLAKRETINLYCNFPYPASGRLVWINRTWRLFNRYIP